MDQAAFALRIFEFPGNADLRYAATTTPGFSWAQMSAPDKIKIQSGDIWQVPSDPRPVPRVMDVPTIPHVETFPP